MDSRERVLKAVNFQKPDRVGCKYSSQHKLLTQKEIYFVSPQIFRGIKSARRCNDTKRDFSLQKTRTPCATKFNCRSRLPPTCSSSQSMVRLQQTTQAFDANNLRCFFNSVFGLNDPAQRLVNAFVMVILTILFKNIFKLLYRGQNQMIQTLGFYGFDIAFGVAIQIWTSRRKPHWFHADALQYLMESIGSIQRITIMD